MNTDQKSIVHLSVNAKEKHSCQNIKTAGYHPKLIALVSRFLNYLKGMKYKYKDVKTLTKVVVNEKPALPDMEETMLFNAVQTASRPHKLN